MAIIVKVGKAANFEGDLITGGIHPIVYAEMLDLGWRKNRFDRSGKKPIIHQALAVVQTDEEIAEGDFAGQRKEAWIFYNVPAGLAARTTLRKHLEGFRGKPYKEAEIEKIKADGLDIEAALLGKCFLAVFKQETKGQGDKAKLRSVIESTMPWPKEGNKPKEPLLVVEGYTPIAERENLDLDKIVGEPATAEEIEAEESREATASVEGDDEVPF